MRRLLLLMLLALPIGAETIYDERGIYDGRVDEYDNQYDQYGTYKGRVDEEGRIYNRFGTYSGRIEVDDGKELGTYIIPGYVQD